MLFLLHRWTVCTLAWVFFQFQPFPIPEKRGVRHLFTAGRGGRFGVEFGSVAWIGLGGLMGREDFLENFEG